MSDHYHYDYAHSSHDHPYAESGHRHDYEYAEMRHRHYDDESTAEGLREDLSGAEARIYQLEQDYGRLQGSVEANLASLNEIIAEMAAVVSTDPAFLEMTVDVLREHTWALGLQFQGTSAPPAAYDEDEEQD